MFYHYDLNWIWVLSALLDSRSLIYRTANSWVGFQRQGLVVANGDLKQIFLFWYQKLVESSMESGNVDFYPLIPEIRDWVLGDWRISAHWRHFASIRHFLIIIHWSMKRWFQKCGTLGKTFHNSTRFFNNLQSGNLVNQEFSSIWRLTMCNVKANITYLKSLEMPIDYVFRLTSKFTPTIL